MKRGFTLIELLIVVAVIATLMSVMFRLGSIGSSAQSTSVTATRVQKVENCLSGYYAAFGSYPPVAVYGYRDIYREVQGGTQTENRNENLEWQQIRAACKAQPVAASFPYPESEREEVDAYSNEIRERVSSGNYKNYSSSDMAAQFQQGFSIGNVGSFKNYWRSTDMKNTPIFRFGLMSYLLPRYLFMLEANGAYYGAGDGDESTSGSVLTESELRKGKTGGPCAQWSNSNAYPCDPFTGERLSWGKMRGFLQSDDDGKRDKTREAHVTAMASQAVTARWLPNLAYVSSQDYVVSATRDLTFYGVKVCDQSGERFALAEDEDSYPPDIDIFSPGGGSGGGNYILQNVTVKDGWGNDLYYYSPSPHQSYVLWSAGANGVTFPPWADRDNLGTRTMGGTSLTVSQAVEDDIVRMKN